MSDDILAALAAPFDPALISWRVGATNREKTKGMALAYIDARDVQDRLNAVMGLNWQVRNPWSCGTKLACEIGLKIDGEWIWRGDGAGDSDVEAEKGAFSDSFKRAAVRWGVGRYLYDAQSPWVAIEAFGKSWKIPDAELKRLVGTLARPQNAAAPKATPEGPSAGSGAQTAKAGQPSSATRGPSATTPASRSSGPTPGEEGMLPDDGPPFPGDQPSRVSDAEHFRKLAKSEPPADFMPAKQTQPMPVISEAGREFLAAMRKRIGEAKLPSKIDDLIKANRGGLERLNEESAPAHDDLMSFALARQQEMLAGTG